MSRAANNAESHPAMKIAACVLLFLTVLLSAAAIGAVPIFPVDTTTAGFVGLAAQGPLDQSVFVGSYEEFAEIFGTSTAGLANPYLAPSVAGFFANGGLGLYVVRVAANDDNTIIGFDGGMPGARTGLQALRDVDSISIVAIPGAATPAVQAAMIALCESEGDRMAILDPASPNDLNAIQVQRAGLATAGGYAALYFPWIQAAPAGISLLLPPSGFVAASYSATDPPESPVGAIATASSVAYSLTAPEQDILVAQNINPIRDLSGIRIWGARTLAADVEWRYVATRRLTMFIDESINEGTAWCVFEPNDAPLWSVLTQDMGDFLYSLWLAGWLQGATPGEAFFAQCGLGLTMTFQDLEQGRTVLLLGFAVVRPSEFTILQIAHERLDLSAVPAGVTPLIELTAPVPNPFNPTTSLRFLLAEAARVSLRVFDTRGRLVRTIVADEVLAAGEHRRPWQGRDDAGQSVASGVYLVLIEGAGAGASASAGAGASANAGAGAVAGAARARRIVLVR